MTSPAKRATNRLNARASTGPKTARGRSHSSRNARKHGLNVSVLLDPLLSKDVEATAVELVGMAADLEIHQRARDVAIALIEIYRIRAARQQLFAQPMADREWDTVANRRAKDRAVMRSLRTTGPFIPMPNELVEFVDQRPTEAEKFALVLETRHRELLILERYERRALSKRKFAMRALDAALRRAAKTE